MERIPMDKAREDFADTVNRVAYAGARVLVERRGKPMVALVSVSDLELLERLEDEADVRAARRILSDMKRTGEEPIPLAVVAKKLGL